MLNNKIDCSTKFNVIKYALESRNVAETCRIFNISRTTYYKWLHRYRHLGIDGLKEVERKKPAMPNKASKEIEHLVLLLAKEKPKYGPQSYAYELSDQGIKINQSGVYNILKRYGLNTMKNRLSLKGHNMTSKDKFKKPYFISVPFKKWHPGFVMEQFTTSIGNLKGLGILYQTVLIDVYSGFVIAQVYNSKSSLNAIDIIENMALPTFYPMDIKIKNLVTMSTQQYATNWEKGKHKFTEFLKHQGIRQWPIPINYKNYERAADHFNPIVYKEFYEEVLQREYSDIEEIRDKLKEFIKHYNFHRCLNYGQFKGKVPASVLIENCKDLDAIPMWLT